MNRSHGSPKPVRWCAAVALCLVSAAAHADRSDREKPLMFEADRSYNVAEKDSADSRVLEGNVVITQGTMRIAANKLILRQDKDGLRFGEGFGAPVFFTQKQEGRTDFFEAYGERVEFDERTDNVKLFSKAKLKIGKDELTAEYIVYNTATEKYEVAGAPPGTSLPQSTGRVTGVLYPGAKDGTPARAPDPASVPASAN
jgi:lipopolysaccharide export system protein LptA